MTPEKEGELFTKIDMLLNLVSGLAGRVGKIEQDVAELRGEVKGRLEEQSRLLVALVPQQIAAISGKR